MRDRGSRLGRAYAAIPNAMLRDRTLSIEARGFLAMLMSYSDDWEFRVEHMAWLSGLGRDKLRGVLRELSDAGYLDLSRSRDDTGRMTGSTWTIRDDPRCDGTQDIVSSQENRPPENPSPGGDENSTTDCHRPPEKPTAGFSVAYIRKPTGKKYTSVSDETEDACASQPWAEEAFAKQVFDLAVVYLGRHGVSERQARALVGKWRKEAGDERAFDAMNRANREGVTDPVAWITKALASHAQFSVKFDLSKFGEGHGGAH